MVWLISVASLSAQQIDKKKGTTTDVNLVVSPQVIASAQMAVQTLGDKVVKGDFMFAYKMMYLRHKKRQEALHGKQNLKNQFVNAANQLNKLNVAITQFKAERPTGFFKVWPVITAEAKLKIARGEQASPKANEIEDHWMIIVPTTQVWSFMKNRSGKVRRLSRKGFQIAVAKVAKTPGQEKWTFVDGASMKPQQLRALFPSLAADLLLPKKVDKELK